MSAVTLLFIALSGAVIFAIAAIVIGREAHRLDGVAPRAVYDIDEATAFVADRIPTETQARLTYEELKKMLVLHMRWLHEKGLQPSDVIDRRQDRTNEVIIAEDSLTAFLFDQAEGARIEVLDDVDVVHVVREHLNYFDAIGAIGPNASSIER